MHAFKIKDDFKPLSEFKTKASEIVRQVEETGRPVVITRHGRGVAVVLSVEAFEEYRAGRATLEFRNAIAEGESDIAAGRTVPHEEVVREWEHRLGVSLRHED